MGRKFPLMQYHKMSNRCFVTYNSLKFRLSQTKTIFFNFELDVIVKGCWLLCLFCHEDITTYT